MKQTEPPSCSSSLVFIGKNSRGNWVAQEQSGLFGGLFVNRAAAVKFALFENGRHLESVIDAPNLLELTLNGGPSPSDRALATSDTTLQRRAA